MKIACIGGGPAGLYFAISMKLRDPAHEIHVFERNAERRDLRLGRRLLRPDGREPHGQRPGVGQDHRRRVRPLGRHRRPHPRRMHPLVGPRLHRHRPQAAARDPADSARASWASSSTSSSECDPDDSPTGPTGTWSSPPTASTAASATRYRRRISGSTSTSAPTGSSGSARARRSTPSPSPSRRPRPGGSGPTPIASPTTARPSSSNARKRPGAALGFDRMDQAETIARVREASSPNISTAHRCCRNAAHLRGSAAWLKFRRINCERWHARQVHPARRRRAHRAFLDRIGHQAGARGCDQAGRGAQPARPRPRSRRWPNIRPSAASRCSSCRTARATRPNGSRRSSATSHFEPLAVRLFAADPHRSASATRICGCATATGWKSVERWFWERAGRHGQDRAADVRAVQAARNDARRTASSSRRWRCIRRSTARPTTSTSSISARARRAAPGWCSPR